MKLAMPLSGIRVLDLTRLLPGPFCSLLLADLGADVIKVEEPGRGDYMRWYPPLRDGQSVAFNAINRNKRSITLNLKSERGKELFLELVKGADVLLEGNRPGVMDRLGLGWDVLSKANPELVMCAITGYGQAGPYRDRAGHDLNYMAIAGALSLNSRPGEPIHPLGVQVADLGGGAQSAAIAILAALVAVQRGGSGRYLDVSMLDGALTWLASPLALVEEEGRTPAHGGHRLTGLYACYRVYECADGRFMSVGALEPKFWEALCGALGRPDLVQEQYAEGERQERLQRELEGIFKSRGRDDWAAELDGPELCCEPVLELDEVASHPQVKARRLIEVQPTGLEIAPPVRIREGWRTLPPPRLGEHNAEILAEVGVEPQDLARLAESGVL